MEGLFFIAMISAIGACAACAAVAYDMIHPFSRDEFDAVVKRNADLDAALNFKADDQHNNNEGVLMRTDELEILP
jgi:hypothetical protein